MPTSQLSQTVPPRSRRGWSIKSTLAIWTVGLVLAFTLLSGGFLYSVTRMHAKTARIYADSLSLQTNHAFEGTVLALGRQHLQRERGFRPGLGVESEPNGAPFRASETLLGRLVEQSTSDTERQLVREIENDYLLFKNLVQIPGSSGAGVQRALDALDKDIKVHERFNQGQMRATMAESSRIDRLVDTLVLLLIPLAFALVLSGSYWLWRRVFIPVLHLTATAEQLASNLQVRANVSQEDEMGQLARTFNTMAEAVSEREKERLQFVATVAHDLKNPLMVVGGATHLLQNRANRLSETERQVWLHNILKMTRKLELIIEDLTDAVHLETGQVQFQLEDLDFAQLGQDAVQEQSTAHQAHLIRYDGPQNCPLRGDAGRLERMLNNLISNAIKYSPRGSVVQVGLKVDNSTATLTVSDEGAGISPDELQRLFQPFSRLERNRKLASGTGLGLSSVKKIVEGHGGVISVQSEVDQGSTFSVRLPLTGPSRTGAR